MCYHYLISYAHEHKTPQDACGDLCPTDFRVHCVRRYEALIKALGGAVSEREGSRVRVELNGEQWRCHRPHPGKEAKRYQVEEVRELMERAGVQP